MEWSSVFAAVVVAVPTAWLTAQFSLQNFRHQRWWEKRAGAYETVIAAVEQLHSNASTAMENAYRGKEPTAFDEKEFESWAVALREVRRAFHTAEYLLSVEVKGALKEYLRARRQTHTDYIEAVESSYGETLDCLKQLTQIARRDLAIDRSPLFKRDNTY